MTADDVVVNRLLGVMSDVLGVPRSELSVDTTADSVSTWDSINILNMAMALESEFKLSLTPEEIAEMLSVRLILEILKGKGVQ